MEKRKIKIDELKKDNIFRVPEGYFEELPSVIQSRVTEQPVSEPVWFLRPQAKWALAAASVLILAVYFSVFRSYDPVPSDVESLIAQVNTEDLVSYIEYTDITTDELLASVELEEINFDDLSPENEFLEDIDLDELESLDLLESIEVSTELL